MTPTLRGVEKEVKVHSTHTLTNVEMISGQVYRMTINQIMLVQNFAIQILEIAYK